MQEAEPSGSVSGGVLLLWDHNVLHQYHIKDGSPRNGKKHLALPDMKENDKENGEKFRHAAAAGKQVYIPQTVDHQQAKDCRWQDFSRYCMYFGVGFPAGKMRKGRKRVRAVPRMTIAMVISCSDNVMMRILLSLRDF